MAAEWVPAVTAGITTLAALGGQAIAGLLQGRNQERVEARQRRQQAAEVLAEARAFLVDASPDRIGINASQERTPEVLRELQERRERIRIPLLTLAGSHPSPHVRRLAQQLEVEMANMLHMAGFLVSDLLGRRAPGAAREQPTSTTRRRWVCSTSFWTRSTSRRRAGRSAAGCSGAGGNFRAVRAAGDLTARPRPRSVIPVGLCARREPCSGRRGYHAAPRRCEVESTWERRDLPILEAVVRLFDERPDVVSVTIKGIADLTGMQPIEVYAAAKALSPTYLTLQEMMAPPEHHRIRGVTDSARRAVGQWPSPEAVADRIVAALLEAADQEPDERKRTKLRAAAETLGSFGRDLLINVAANVATKPIAF